MTTTEDQAVWPLWLFKSVRTLYEEDDMAHAIEISKLQSNREGNAQAWALIRAGWRLEWPERDYLETFSWAWRRPPKRPGKPGRRFASTNQAYNAMMREMADVM